MCFNCTVILCCFLFLSFLHTALRCGASAMGMVSILLFSVFHMVLYNCCGVCFVVVFFYFLLVSVVALVSTRHNLVLCIEKKEYALVF